MSIVSYADASKIDFKRQLGVQKIMKNSTHLTRIVSFYIDFYMYKIIYMTTRLGDGNRCSLLFSY